LWIRCQRNLQQLPQAVDVRAKDRHVHENKGVIVTVWFSMTLPIVLGYGWCGLPAVVQLMAFVRTYRRVLPLAIVISAIGALFAFLSSLMWDSPAVITGMTAVSATTVFFTQDVVSKVGVTCT
jgi:hypothetical protein